jgi:hypothetical protein
MRRRSRACARRAPCVKWAGSRALGFGTSKYPDAGQGWSRPLVGGTLDLRTAGGLAGIVACYATSAVRHAFPACFLPLVVAPYDLQVPRGI